ncbi:hypothetical protein [Natronosalvus caseinilyticus]|uniref:hypothetical protein n=1 Tax=Natronosalvus caseinilyticus TaxID=2953747 RepID=UPI0028B21191|nr:hypothetical protein [Natronosalvus caseinilyticus]
MSLTHDNPAEEQSDNDSSSDIHNVWVEFKDRLDNVEDNPATTGKLASEFARNLATAHVYDGADSVVIDSLLGQFARNANVQKGKLEETYETYVETLEAEAEADKEENADNDGIVVISPDKLLTNHVAKVIKYCPTDASADARYLWVFEDGETMETKRQHLALNSFSDEAHDQLGRIVSDNTSDDCDLPWRTFVKLFIERHKEEREEKGDRSYAVEDLRAVIEQRPATTEKDDAAMSSLPWVNEDEDGVLYVPSDIVQRVLIDYDTINARDLQVELDERGVKLGNVKQTSAAGTLVRFWPLTRNFADVSLEECDDDE